MYSSAYKKLFWAIIFTVFDFNLGPLNIIPDFIGYTLIYVGLSQLSKQQVIFEKGKIPAAILSMAKLGSILNFQDPVVTDLFMAVDPVIVMFFEGVVSILEIYLLFIICKGIFLTSQRKGLSELVTMTKTRWTVKVLLSIVMLFVSSFSINISNEHFIGFFVFGIIDTVSILFIAGLFRRASVLLAD